MNQPPFNHQNSSARVPRRVGKARPLPLMPWSFLVLALVLHIFVGVLLSVFSPPFWVWPLAFAGTLLQAIMFAGPKALSSLQGWWILLSRFVTCVGVALSVVALAVAVGYGGSNDIDSIQIMKTGLGLLFVNLGVLLLTAGCSLLIAHIGDRLLMGMGRARSSLCVLSFCFLGLFFGGALGLAIAS